MTDLAKQAAESLWNTDRPLYPKESLMDSVVEVINRVGTLVSHEDAELLRQVKRLISAITNSDRRSSFIDYIGYAMDETQWKVAYDRGANPMVVF